MLERTVTIVNERGLHARAAAKFTSLAEEFDADIVVSNGREDVGGSPRHRDATDADIDDAVRGLERLIDKNRS